MDKQTYIETIKKLENLAQEVIDQKRPSYTINSDDVLANFKRNAKVLGLTPSQVCAVYFMKHIDSILAYISTGTQSSESIESRYVDALNYLKLSYALYVEGIVEGIVGSMDKTGMNEAGIKIVDEYEELKIEADVPDYIDQKYIQKLEKIQNDLHPETLHEEIDRTYKEFIAGGGKMDLVSYTKRYYGDREEAESKAKDGLTGDEQ